MGVFAQIKNIKQALSAKIERAIYEESIPTHEDKVLARHEVGSGGPHAAGNCSFVPGGGGPPAVVTALWIQLRGMVGQMVAVDLGAILGALCIVG
jgi:hypothetical protein